MTKKNDHGGHQEDAYQVVILHLPSVVDEEENTDSDSDDEEEDTNDDCTDFARSE